MIRVEKIPSLKCGVCNSYQVMLVGEALECDNCSKLTALSIKKEKLSERCDHIVSIKLRSNKKNNETFGSTKNRS
jgi:hypothetical protein